MRRRHLCNIGDFLKYNMFIMIQYPMHHTPNYSPGIALRTPNMRSAIEKEMNGLSAGLVSIRGKLQDALDSGAKDMVSVVGLNLGSKIIIIKSRYIYIYVPWAGKQTTEGTWDGPSRLTRLWSENGADYWQKKKAEKHEPSDSKATKKSSQFRVHWPLHDLGDD